MTAADSIAMIGRPSAAEEVNVDKRVAHPRFLFGPNQIGGVHGPMAYDMVDGADRLSVARWYRELGWNVIPVINKVAPVRWSVYQSASVDEVTLRWWFKHGFRDGDLAVINGPVSGNLACRDFDDPAAYRRWADAHPDLANTLPTVRTPRGYHVYFRCAPGKTRPGVDGELRLTGYNVVPSGPVYEDHMYCWVQPP